MGRKRHGCLKGILLIVVIACAAVLVAKLLTGQESSSDPVISQKVVDTASAEITLHSAVSLAEETEGNMQQITRISLPTVKGCNPVQYQQGLDSLTDPGMQDLYEKMEEKVYRVAEKPAENGLYPTERIVVRGSELTAGEIVQVIYAFSHDHPEIFWISGQYGYSIGGGNTTIQLYATASAAECSEISKKILTQIGSILGKLSPNISALDREITIYNEIIARCTYDDAAASDDSDWRAHSIVGVFLDDEAVCEGYARAVQLLLNQAGVPCMLATGTAGGAHMWNLVRIDGQWYHADPTWDDNGSVPLYQYLNVTDAMIRQDHTLYAVASETEEVQPDKLYNLPLPSCTATKANYFQARGVQIRSDDPYLLTAELKRAAENGDKAVYLYIDESLDYDTMVRKLFQEDPFMLYTAVESVNSEGGVQLSYTDCTYVEAKACRGVAVMLSYTQ